MPLYDYECFNCGWKTEKLFPISDIPGFIPCEGCDSEAQKVIVKGHGGIQVDECPSWMPSALKTLQPQVKNVRPLQTRGEFNKYLKEKGIVQLGGDFKVDGKWSMI